MKRSKSGIADPFRRRHLKSLVALGLSAGLGPAAVRGAQPVQRLRSIPSSGEQIPAMGLGTARTFDVGFDADARAPLAQVLSAFVAAGGTMVDSSPMYGAAEAVVGELARQTGVGGRLFYATKVWTEGRAAGEQQMRQSMQLMGTERIDLMQVHNLVDTRTHLQTIREWRERGLIRYTGVTHYTASAFDELQQVIKKERIDYVQFPYSIANRAAEERLLAVAAEHGVAVIAHRNFERGSLFRRVRGQPLPSWAQEFDCFSWGNFFLKYLLADSRVTNLIPATRKVKHLEDNMRAGLGRLPDSRTRARMVQYLESL